MSEFQKYATDIIISEIAKLPRLDKEKSSYCIERAKATNWRHSHIRQDIYTELYYKDGSCDKCAIEIKSGVPDFRSGYGLNFTEDYNFLCFKAGYSMSGSPIKTKHIAGLDKDIGVLVIVNDSLYCLRPAFHKGVDGSTVVGAYLKDSLWLRIGRSTDELLMDIIDGA